MEFITFAIRPLDRFLRGVYTKKVHNYYYDFKQAKNGYFVRGTRVQAVTGEKGKVWRVYRSLETNEVKGCTVVWDTEYKGEKVSLFLPANDMGIAFNPVLRRQEYEKEAS